MAEAKKNKCEVVNIYGVKSPISPKFSEVYSIHIKIPEIRLDIKGVSLRYCEKKKRIWIMFPSRKGIVQGKPCHFPFISFNDKETQMQIFQEIREYFIEWRKTNVFENAEPANDAPTQPKKSHKPDHTKRPDYDPTLGRLFPRRNSKANRSDTR